VKQIKRDSLRGAMRILSALCAALLRPLTGSPSCSPSLKMRPFGAISTSQTSRSSMSMTVPTTELPLSTRSWSSTTSTGASDVP